MLTVTYTPATDTRPSRLRVVHDTTYGGKVSWWVAVNYYLDNEEQCRAIAQSVADKREDTVMAGYESLVGRRPFAKARPTWTFLLAKGLPMCR
jgi:hypothetical protein